MNKELKFCKNCKHADISEYGNLRTYCHHPKATKRHRVRVSIFDGTKDQGISRKSLFDMRYDFWRCGKKARYFEPRKTK